MIEIVNRTSEKIEKAKFIKIGEKILGWEQRGDFYFSLVFENSDKMKEINFKYRHKDSDTDVLSFESKGDKNLELDSKYLGEIIICPKRVRNNAREEKKPYKDELYLVFIHGILHLLGYDHESNEADATLMEEKQVRYLKKAKDFF
jgi:probable rRNA maturation factor